MVLRWRVVVGVVWATILFQSAAGCSLVFVDAPPRRRQGITGWTCTSTYGWVFIDGALAAVPAVYAATVLAQPESAFVGKTIKRDERLGASLLALLGFALSAISGGMRVSDCNDALDEEAEAEAAVQRTPKPRPTAPRLPAPPSGPVP